MKFIGCKLLFGASALMVLGFGIHLLVDYFSYKTDHNSAPFWIWAVMDVVLWLIPAALAFVAGLVVRRKIIRRK